MGTHSERMQSDLDSSSKWLLVWDGCEKSGTWAIFPEVTWSTQAYKGALSTKEFFYQKNSASQGDARENTLGVILTRHSILTKFSPCIQAIGGA